MNRLIALLFTTILVVACSVQAQNVPTKSEIVGHYGFEQVSIQVNGEEIVFYTYQAAASPAKKLVLYLQGSDPSPQFSYRIQNGKVQKLCWLKGEFRSLSDEYLYVVVEKIGFEGVIDEDNIPKPQIYQQKNSLQNRVLRADAVINFLNDRNAFEKVIVYGHSEGAPVAAKLATVNSKITHLGFWAGNALPDFYDFVLESRIAYFKGEISDSTAQARIDETIEGFKEVAADPLNTDGGGYTNLRWWSYAEPPINNLLEIDIPIFVQVASEDKSAPIESTYLIPLEFARLGKSNLSYNVCVGCDHGFSKAVDDGENVNLWRQIFSDFIEWTEHVEY